MSEDCERIRMKDGRLCTIPPNTDSIEELKDALQNHLSPEAVAVIAAHIQSTDIKDEYVRGQVLWFYLLLVDLLGDGYSVILEEMGL